jgi:phosphoglycerol transferase
MRNPINQIPAALLYLAQALIVLGIAYLRLHLSSYDLRVPFNYSGDAVIILMYIKGLIQDGWPTTISQLSAPFAYSGAAFPLLTSVDWLIIKIASLFTAEPGYLLNGFWLLTLVFSAWSATYAAVQLGLSRVLSFVTGVLYAFLPFALLRNVAHLNLVYYLVPLLCLLAVVIAGKGENVRNSTQASIVGLVAAALQGFNYVYYSFFAVLLFAVATLISYQRGGGFKQFKLPLLAIVMVTLSTAINMIPAMQSWHTKGSPPEMAYKYTAEVEIYGAKLRRMLIPHPDNVIRPLAEIAQKDAAANFPNENENTTVRLGLYGALGLLLMIVTTLRRSVLNAPPQPIAAISALGLATFLIITVGGLGAVINLLSVPDIRCYNRFSVYLAFFAMVAAGLCLQGKLGCATFRWKMAGRFIIGAFAALSLYDQLLDAKPLVATQQNDMHRANAERTVVARLEHLFQKDAAVLALPFTGYPPLATINRMESYDHARPYVWSQHLKWSWPSFSQRHRAWQTRMAALQGSDLMRAAILSGFDAIWIDRFAYVDDGQALISSLTLAKVKPLDLGSSRFAVLDIREAAADLKASIPELEFRQHASALLGSEILLEWKKGFYGEEQNPAGHRLRWAQDQATMELRNSGKGASTVCITFVVASPAAGRIRLAGGADSPVDINASSIPRSIRLPLSLEPGEARTLQFSTQLPRLDAPGDSRKLYFYVMDVDLAVSGHLVTCN